MRDELSGADVFEMSRKGIAALLGHVDDAILCCDDLGTIRFASDAVRTLLGFDPDSIVGRNLVDFTHSDDVDGVLAAMGRWVGREGTPEGEQVTVLTSDGTWRTVFYDAVISAELAGLGPLIVTLRPIEHSSSTNRDFRLLALNGDRIVRLASAFLHVPYEDFEKGIDVALEELAGLSSVTRVSIWLFENHRAVLQAEWSAPIGAPTVPLASRIPVADFAMLRRVAAGQEVHLSEPWQHGAELTNERRLFVEAGTTALMATPMSSGDELSGMLMLESTLDLTAFDVMHATTMRSASAIIAEAYVRRAAEQRLAEQARTDRVTGLGNRWAFDEAVSRSLDAVATGSSPGFGMAMLDLDHFKMVNDSLGHRGGDRLLADVATRLVGASKPDTTLARLGGDELLVLIDGSTSPAATWASVQALAVALEAPFDIGGRTTVTTASIGVLHQADADATAAELLQHVDLAVARAKALGGDTIEMDDPAARGGQSSRMRRVAELRQALADDEFDVHYQGEWDLESGALIGAEALVRWNHPVEGLLTAAEFVPLAEGTGMIRELGAMVLRRACRDAQPWVLAMHERPFEIRVNLAAQQLRQRGIVDMVADTLVDSGLPAQSLCLELTESTLLADPAGSAALFGRLRDLGVGLAIDDFGTGYSSLLQLKRMPLTALKIDRAFVTGLPDDVNDRAIVEAILALAGSLGYSVTAEGVETDRQREALLELGCHRAQGFLLSMPEPAAEFTRRIVVD